jgi:LMBR1-like membrane protein
MVDIFLIVVTVVAFLILLVVGVYLVIYYQHPDDKNESYAAKLVVIFGFVLAGGTVLMLPLDVANNEGYAGMCIIICNFCCVLHEREREIDFFQCYPKITKKILLLHSFSQSHCKIAHIFLTLFTHTHSLCAFIFL